MWLACLQVVSRPSAAPGGTGRAAGEGGGWGQWAESRRSGRFRPAGSLLLIKMPSKCQDLAAGDLVLTADLAYGVLPAFLWDI